jgi:predicted membrane protein
MPWRLLFGLILFIIGLGFLLVQVNVIPDRSFMIFLSQWWPLIIVGTSLNQLIRRMERPWGSLIVFAVGVILLAYAQDRIPTMVVPFIGTIALLVLGMRLILPRQVQRFSSNEANGFSGLPVRYDHTTHDAVFFGGLHYRDESQQYQGGKSTVIFGDYELDLRGAALGQKGADLKVTALFGTVKIRIPEPMNLVLSGVPVLGSIENRTRPIAPVNDGRPVLRLKFVAIVGAVEILN